MTNRNSLGTLLLEERSRKARDKTLGYMPFHDGGGDDVMMDSSSYGKRRSSPCGVRMGARVQSCHGATSVIAGMSKLKGKPSRPAPPLAGVEGSVSLGRTT